MKKLNKKQKEKPPGLHTTFFSKISKKIIQLLNNQIENLDELKSSIQQSHNQGIISHESHTMLEGVLAIDDLRVRDVMIPALSMATIEISSNVYEVQKTISESLHSRYPVVDEKGTPQGLLYVKDLVQFLLKRKHQFEQKKQNRNHNRDPWADFDLNQLTRQYETVPEFTRLSVLLNQFRRGKNHLALVVNEHKQLIGLITIEDVLEQIVGEIRDEYDDEEVMWILDHEHQSTVKGLTPIDTFNQHFVSHLSSEQNETIAGVILSHHQSIPKQGERIVINDLIFKILKADSRRIHLMSVKKRPLTEEEIERKIM